jgi:hypothetical protein
MDVHVGTLRPADGATTLELLGLAGRTVCWQWALPEEGVEAGFASDGEVDCQELPAAARHVVHMERQRLGVVGAVGAEVLGLLGHARIVGPSMRDVRRPRAALPEAGTIYWNLEREQKPGAT